MARQYFEASLKLYPEGIDTNYFYGDFLLGRGDYELAIQYLEKAEKAPVRPGMQISDLKLKQEIAQAIRDARSRNDSRRDFFSQFIPAFGENTASH
jgi:tetratricopeptide (TPR) repeat protein